MKTCGRCCWLPHSSSLSLCYSAAAVCCASLDKANEGDGMQRKSDKKVIYKKIGGTDWLFSSTNTTQLEVGVFGTNYNMPYANMQTAYCILCTSVQCYTIIYI